MSSREEMFSKGNPKLQIAWDATSLTALSFCPRRYQYEILEGWRSVEGNAHLEFGLLAHGAMETFDRAILAGDTFEGAQFQAVEYALKRSVSPERPLGYTEKESLGEWVPWGGRYEQMWKCSGDAKYKPEGVKGRRKCPYALAKVWMPAPAPQVCGECGGSIEERNMWIADVPGKSRPELVRHVVWWTEEMRGDNVHPVRLADGKPAVEVNFRVRLPFVSPYGEGYVLCGYLDGLCVFVDERFARERKTTKTDLGAGYWNGFSPNMQIDTYDLAASAIPEMADVRGVLIEAGQTILSGSRFGRRIEYRNSALRDEHMAQVGDLIEDAERYAAKGHWPMRKSQCKFCPFRGICAMSPGKRADFLASKFKRSFWNPLEER